MADHELNMCPIWDITVSHTLAFLKYEPAIVDFSITLGGGRYGTVLRLLCMTLLPSRLVLELPRHPFCPLEMHLEMPNRLQTGVRGCASTMCKKTTICLPKLRTVILMVPQEVLEPLKDDYG